MREGHAERVGQGRGRGIREGQAGRGGAIVARAGQPVKDGVERQGVRLLQSSLT